MKIKNQEREWFVMLLNEAVQTYGYNQEFIQLERSDLLDIQEAIIHYVKNNKLIENVSSYGVSGDRVLYTYRQHLRKGREEISCSEKIINSIVHYATNGQVATWALYKRGIKNLDTSPKPTLKADENQGKHGQSRPNKPIPVVVELPNADFKKDDEKDEWMVYELAFLWHEKEPPSIQAHFTAMTRDIELTKSNLHNAVDSGLLEARQISYQGVGYTRFITREALEAYVKKQGLERPTFLKREERLNK